MGDTSKSDPIAPGRRLLETKASAEASFSEAVAAKADRQMADAVRVLANDAVDIGRGDQVSHTLAMADVAAILWSSFLRFDAASPCWPDRDRFISLGSEAFPLTYALSHLTGHPGLDLGAVERSEHWDRPGSGQCNYGEHLKSEATMGQGLAMAVGVALAERMLAAKFGRSLVNHRTWVVGSDNDLLEGESHEAACLAGHLRLEKLTVLWNDTQRANQKSDPLKQFSACGWATKRVDTNDAASIISALSFAIRAKKPTLIVCQAPKGLRSRAEPELVRQTLSGDVQPPGPPLTSQDLPVELSKDLREKWTRIGLRGTVARRSWLKRLNNHALRADFERVTAGRLPEAWSEATASLKSQLADTHPMLPTWQTSERIIQSLSVVIPELVGGSPELASNRTEMNGSAIVDWENFGGRYLYFGLREQSMAACLNGMGVHNGLIPYGKAPLVYTDALRPAFRLAARLRQRFLYVLDQDGAGRERDERAQHPIEQLACLRATSGLSVFRPADGMETAECWELALRRADGPSVLVLSHKPVPAVRSKAGENRCARGGYVLAEADGPRQATLIATGNEVALAMDARRKLSNTGIAVAVVSLPCWDLFAGQDESYRAAVLGAVLRVGVEAACGFGWERWLGPSGIFVGISSPGVNPPTRDLSRHFGINPDAIVSAVCNRLQQPLSEGT